MEDGSLSMSMDPSLMPMELPPVQLLASGFGNDQMLPKPEDLLMSNGMMSMPMQVPQPLPMVAMGEQVRNNIGRSHKYHLSCAFLEVWDGLHRQRFGSECLCTLGLNWVRVMVGVSKRKCLFKDKDTLSIQ